MSISSIELGQLQSTMFYGIGGFLFFFMIIYAIIIFQVYMYSQNKEVAPLYTTFFKILYFYIGLLAFLLVFFAILIALHHSKFSNPAVGLYGFFHLPWDNIDQAMKAIEQSPAYTQSPVAQRETIKWYAFILATVKILYKILVVGSYLFVPLFAAYYPYEKCKRAMDQGDGSGLCIGHAAFSGVLYTTLIYLMLLMSQGAINYLIGFAVDNNYAAGISPNISHFDAFRDSFQVIRDNMIKYIQGQNP